MQNKFFKLGTLAAALFAVGCAETAIYDLEKAPKEGSEFNISLANEYLALAKKESRIYNDSIDSRHFALKGEAAARNEMVMPEALDDWDLHKNDLPMIVDGRQRLLFALDRGGRFIEPELGAKTQVFFDCMVEEYEEGPNLHKDQTKEMQVCKTGFWKHLGDLETAVFKNGATRSVAFDYNVAVIEHDGMLTIKDVAMRVKKFQDRKVMLVGHTDPLGKAGHNKNLSYARANAVKDALVKEGVPARMIKVVVGRGELKTSRREVEPRNRNVDIYLY